jgi:hypothetical protein
VTIEEVEDEDDEEPVIRVPKHRTEHYVLLGAVQVLDSVL